MGMHVSKRSNLHVRDIYLLTGKSNQAKFIFNAQQMQNILSITQSLEKSLWSFLTEPDSHLRVGTDED